MNSPLISSFLKHLFQWEMGEYEWMSYREVEAKVSNVAAGLRDLTNGDEQKVSCCSSVDQRAHHLRPVPTFFLSEIPFASIIRPLREEKQIFGFYCRL